MLLPIRAIEFGGIFWRRIDDEQLHRHDLVLWFGVDLLEGVGGGAHYASFEIFSATQPCLRPSGRAREVATRREPRPLAAKTCRSIPTPRPTCYRGRRRSRGGAHRKIQSSDRSCP